MERVERDQYLEAAITTAMRDEEMITESDLMTGFVVVASFQVDGGGTRLAYWVPQHQAPHASIGMLQLVDDFIRADRFGD